MLPVDSTAKKGKVSGTQLLEWLEKNIVHIGLHLQNKEAQVPGVFLQASEPVHESGIGAHVVHSDIRRIAGLNYHWTTGGDAVVNRWYQEKGKPLYRKKVSPGVQTDSGRVKYDDLTVLAEVITKPHRWYLINTTSLHDVQNIQGLRQGVSVPFCTEKELTAAGFNIKFYGS